MDAPDHGGEVESDGGVVKEELLAGSAVVGDGVDGAMDADEELMEGTVSMFSADIFAGNIIDEEVALDGERDLAGDLAEGDLAADVFGAGEAMESDAMDVGGSGADSGRGWSGGGDTFLSQGGIRR